LGFPQPIYAHIPLILNADKSKMSKRKNKVSLDEYRRAGYLPDAIINFLALLGWHPKDDQEVLSRDELVKLFDLHRVQKAGAIFNQEKLDWLNREYLKKMGDEEIAKAMGDMDKGTGIKGDCLSAYPLSFIRLNRGRANTLNDFLELGKFLLVLPEYEPALLVWRNGTAAETVPILKELAKKLEAISPENFDNREVLVATVQEVIDKHPATGSGQPARGLVLWPLRVALSGQQSSPDPIDIMMALGKEESVKRIKAAAEKLRQ